MTKTKTYTKGIVMPLMRPLPLEIPEPIKWWNLWGRVKNITVRGECRKWEIMEDFILDLPWHDHIVCIPKGFIFDGASVPRFLWPLMAPTGTMFLAGLFHDFGYRYNGWLSEDYTPIEVGVGKSFFDSEFEKIGTYVNDAKLIPNVAWAGVKLGGFMAWSSRRKENANILLDFPVKTIKE